MPYNVKNNKELQILRAAIAVFAKHGYHKSTISRIAQEAEIATGTIYLYFKRKEDLIVALFEQILSSAPGGSDFKHVEGESGRLAGVYYQWLSIYASDAP